MGLVVTLGLLYFLFRLGEREYTNWPVEVAAIILLVFTSVYTFAAAGSHAWPKERTGRERADEVARQKRADKVAGEMKILNTSSAKRKKDDAE